MVYQSDIVVKMVLTKAESVSIKNTEEPNSAHIKLMDSPDVPRGFLNSDASTLIFSSHIILQKQNYDDFFKYLDNASLP